MKTDIWIVVGLIVGIVLQILRLMPAKDHFEVMPIFTPVSIQYEKEYRGDRPLKRLPDVVKLLEEMDKQNVDIALVQQLQKERMALLDLRNRRHDLNTVMMESSIDLLALLSSEQWEFIQSNRDQIQAQVELGMMEQLFQELEE